MRSTLRLVVVFILALTSSLLGLSQAPPDGNADGNNPAGPQGPVGTSNIWHVDPISGSLTVQIAIPTLPTGGRGPSYPYILKYNSGSTITLQAGGTDTSGASDVNNTCTDVGEQMLNCQLTDGTNSGLVDYIQVGGATIIQNYGWWGASTPQETTYGPLGPWTVIYGPTEYNASEIILPQNYSFSIGGGGNAVSYSGCDLAGPFNFIDPSGSSHDLNLSASSGLSQTAPFPLPICTTYTPTSTSDLIDGSAIHATLIGMGLGTIWMPDGTQVLSTNNGTMEDSNGNKRTSTTDSLGRTPVTSGIPLTTVVQGISVGAIPPGTYGISTYNAGGNNTESYQVVFTKVPLGSFTMPYPVGGAPGAGDISTTSFCLASVTCPTMYSVNQSPTGWISGITSLTMPDKTSSYQISYDPKYATIDQITFPTGGHVRFVWGIKPLAVQVKGVARESALVVTDVYTSNDQGGEDHWHYSYPQNTTGGPQWTSTVTAPDGSYTNYTGIGKNFSTIFLGGAPTILESERDMYTSSGTELRSVVTTYGSGPLPSNVTTTYWDISTNNQQQIQYLYDQYDNVIEKDESDFYTCSTPSPCTTSWLRRTFTTYQYQSNSAWVTAHVVNKPFQVLVTDGSSTPNPVSLTTYTYDQPTNIGVCFNITGNTASKVACPTGLITHDGNYDSNTNVARGDLTTESRCISGIFATLTPSGFSADCGPVWNTSYYYDWTGQLTQKVEGANLPTGPNWPATTTYTWSGPNGTSDGYDGFMTQVLHPNGASDSYTYFPPTGEVNTHTGWNQKNQKTTYAYADQMNRLTSITYPATQSGTGLTTYTYADTPGAFTVQEQHLITGSTSTSVTKTYDSLGREVKAVTAAPQCSSGIETDTTYDSMSRVYSVSSPYCSGGSAGSFTEFTYDALSRKLSATTTYNGATTQWSYTGRATEVTEPSNGSYNVQRISQIDGLGRLTSECEVSSVTPSSGPGPVPCGQDIGGTGFLTDYTYDTMGDLCSVAQTQSALPPSGAPAQCPPYSSGDATNTGHIRRFKYDSRSRLTSSINPETGSVYTSGTTTVSSFAPVSYTYSSSSSACSPDPSSPCTKTDARGFKTTYTYDSMARLTGKSYTSPSGPTDFSACFNYDKAVATDSNPLGNMTMSWLQAGTCPTSPVTSIPSAAFNIHIPSAHDAMNRVTLDQQCLTASGCPSSSVGTFNYTYNLLGNLVQANNGLSYVAGTLPALNTSPASLPSLTWNSVYDQADQLVSAGVLSQPSAWSPTNYLTNPALLSPNTSTEYDPFGHLVNAQLGVNSGASAGAVTMARVYDPLGRINSEIDTGASASSAATQSLGTIVINGAEQGPTYPQSSYASATVTISGSDRSVTVNPCAGTPAPACPYTQPDEGTVTVTINGTSVSTSYSPSTTAQQIASTLATEINAASLGVKASAPSSVITVRSRLVGTAGNGTAISATSVTTETAYFSGTSFPVTLSGGTLSGGVNVTPNVYDTGTVSATVNGATASVSFGQGSTPQSIASALGTALQNADGSFLTAKTDGDVEVLVSSSTGTATDWPITTSVTYDSTDFNTPSFTAFALPMAEGDAADPSKGLIYDYYVPQGGYAPNGNILVHSDSVMGDWLFYYDPLNRLATAASGATVSGGNAPAPYPNDYGCWNYDAYGNRTMEAMSTTPCANGPAKLSWASYNPVNSQVTSASTAGFAYDQAGNVLYDGVNNYWYNAEGQLCAVYQSGGSVTAYMYDAEGRRMAKGSLSAVPSGGAAYANVATNGSCGPVTSTTTGFTLNSQYLVDLGGNQATELNTATGVLAWAHSNFWADGKILATYDTGGVHFPLTDPLGTKRIQANYKGTIDLTCISLPFGNGPVCTGDNATEHRFTLKERDSESGNDYFEARYYGSSMGRFLSPDPVIITPERLTNPQQLNLYAYVANNPLRFIDPTGEILQCVGDAKSQSQCFSDLQQIAGDAANRLSMDAKTGVVSFDTKDLDMSKNEGASLVNNLVGSKSTYDFMVGPTIMTDKGPVRIDIIGHDLANLPAFGDQRQIGNPPAGVSDILGLYLNNPNMERGSNTNLKVAPEWTVAFHELAEAFEKIDGGKGGSYEAGHNAALQRELKLRDQRPYLKGYNTGAGGPANSPNPEGKIIIKK